MKLFMLPYAGSIWNPFKAWTQISDNEDVEIISIDYNGRGSRGEYNYPSSWEELIETTTDQILEHGIEDTDYAILGHSMGAKAAYDVYNHIKDYDVKQPAFLVFSGATILSENHTGIINQSEQEFQDYFVRMGGIPKIVLQEEELRTLVLSNLYDDVKLLSEFDYKQDFSNIECDVIIISGDSDKKSSYYEWRRELKKDVAYNIFPGNHFFINQKVNEIYHTLLSRRETCAMD